MLDGCSTSGCSPVLAAARWACGLKGSLVGELGHYAMRRHFAMGMAGCWQSPAWRAPPEGGLNCPCDAHGRGRNGTAVGGDKVHQTKADALHARVGCDLKSRVTPPAGDSISTCKGKARAGRPVKASSGAPNAVDRFHLGHHDVAQACRPLADDGSTSSHKGGMVQRHAHARRYGHRGVRQHVRAPRPRPHWHVHLLPTGAPSSQSRVTSNTQRPSSAVI